MYEKLDGLTLLMSEADLDGAENGGETDTQSPADTGEKLFTQADLDRKISERLARERKVEEAKRSKREEEERRSKMDSEERLKAEKAEAEQKANEAEARATRAERQMSLIGKVKDPAAAVKLLDESRHIDKEGQIKIKALLEDYPILALEEAAPADKPQFAPSRPAPAAGGVQSTAGFNPLTSWAAAETADRHRR